MTTTRPARRAAAGALFVALVLVLATPQHYRNDVHSVNEAARVYAALAIVQHGTVALDPVFDRYFPGWRARPNPPNLDVARVRDHYALDKAPLTTLLAVPVVGALAAVGVDPGAPERFALVAWLLALLLAAVPTALLALVLGRWLVPRHRELAWLAALGMALATHWLAYGGLLFGHALAAALVGGGTLLALGALGGGSRRVEGGVEGRGGGDRVGGGDVRGSRGRLSGADVGGARSWWAIGRLAPLLGGVLLGLAVVAEYPTAVLVAVVCGALLVDSARRHKLPWVALGGVGPLLVLLGWNTVVFGGPLQLSYAYKAYGMHADIIAEGAYGFGAPSLDHLVELMVGASRGLLFLAPWLALGLVGAVAIARRADLALCWRATLAVTAIGFPIVISGFGDWQAGNAMGPRHLLPMLPALAIALVVWLGADDAPWKRASRGALVGLLASSLLVCVTGAWVFPYFGFGVDNPIFEVSLPVLLEVGPGPTIWGASALGWALPLGLAVALLAVPAVALLRRQPGPRLLPVAFAVVAPVLHLALATLPETDGAASARTVIQQRAFVFEQLGHEERARAIRKALRVRPRQGP